MKRAMTEPDFAELDRQAIRNFTVVHRVATAVLVLCTLLAMSLVRRWTHDVGAWLIVGVIVACSGLAGVALGTAFLERINVRIDAKRRAG